jgi:hypothetical protein
MLKTITNVANSLLNTVSGQSNQYSASKELQNAKDIQKMYSDAINTQYAAGIQNLQNQDKTLALQYDPQRALVNSNYERGVRNNEEQMANLGLTRSGTNLTAQLALESERQRGLAEVNSAQDAARRELQAQINEYIAQRDSAIAQQSASIYQNAYDNISEYQRQLAQMEKQHSYDKEMASISHGYDKELAAIDNGYKQEMAKLEYEHSLALANNNYDREAEIKREMAALEQEYAMAKLNRQAELDRQNYSSKAATDWNYYQKQVELDNSYKYQADPEIHYNELADYEPSEYVKQLATSAVVSKKMYQKSDKDINEYFVSLLDNDNIDEEDYIYLLRTTGV